MVFHRFTSLRRSDFQNLVHSSTLFLRLETEGINTVYCISGIFDKITYEVSPKFNCCKMEYLLILRFKGPLRFSMFRTRLSRKLAWPCVFLNGLRDFSCRAPFWRPCAFACVPARFFQSVFVAPLQHGHSSRGGSACMFLRMDGQCS